MRWLVGLVDGALALVFGLGGIFVLVESGFGGSLPGFLLMVGALLLLGALQGYAFSRFGGGSLAGGVLVGLLYAGPVALLTLEIGAPPLLLPLLPLLFISVLWGRRMAARRLSARRGPSGATDSAG